MLLAECPNGWLSSDDVLERVDTFLFKVKDVAAIGLASSLELEEPKAPHPQAPAIQAMPVAVTQEATVATIVTKRPSSNKELELDREECREIARLIWHSDPEKPIDTVAKEIASNDHVVGQPCKWLNGRKSALSVRKWIKDLCPAPRSGRPRKAP